MCRLGRSEGKTPERRGWSHASNSPASGEGRKPEWPGQTENTWTAIIYRETLKGGTRLTRNLSALLKRPYILINVSETPDVQEGAGKILKFIDENKIETFNVAGPRLRGWKEGYDFAPAVMGKVIERTLHP